MISEHRSRRLVSFDSDLMVLANQAAEEEDGSLPVGIEEEDTYAQGASKRELMVHQRRAKSLSTTKVLKEAKLKKRVNDVDSGLDSSLGACRRFVGNNLCGTLKQFSFDDLFVLANAASIACAQEVSRANESKAVVVSVGVEEHTCKQRDCGGSCFELRRNLELRQQQRGKAAPVNVVKPNRDPCDGCREDKLFGKKYVRRKRVNNNTSVEAVAGTYNLVNKLCNHKPSSLTNVNTAEREAGLLLYNNGESQSISEQGCCSGIKNKTKSKTQSGDEAEATTAAVSCEKQSDYLYSAWERGYPKRKRSQLIRKPKEPKKNLDESREEKEQVCDQIGICDISEQESETEEEDVSEVSKSSSCKSWSSFMFNVQWSKKKKRNCMNLEETQSNRKILLLAVEAITHQFGSLN